MSTTEDNHNFANPNPSDHSYLGRSELLYYCHNNKNDSTHKHNHRNSSSSTQHTHTLASTTAQQQPQPQLKKRILQKDLAVLELEDIVLFPGERIPLRLRNLEWIDYLRDRIEMAKKKYDDNDDEDNKVIIGILGKSSSTSAVAEATNEETSNDIIGKVGTLAIITNHFHTQNNNNNNNNDNNETTENEIENTMMEILQQAQQAQQQQQEGEEGSSESSLLERDILRNRYLAERERMRQLQRNERRRQRDNESLLLEAVATKRFRILRKSKTKAQRRVDIMRQWRNEDLRGHTNNGDMIGISFYTIEIIQEELCSLPKSIFHHYNNNNDNNNNNLGLDLSPTLLLNNNIHNLSKRTPIPTFAWKATHPKILQNQILFLLKQNFDIFSGFTKSMEEEEEEQYDSSIAFSYWVSSNLIMSTEDKIKISETSSVSQRLYYIRNKMLGMLGFDSMEEMKKSTIEKQQQQQQQKEELVKKKKDKDCEDEAASSIIGSRHIISCKACDQKISRMEDVFTVDGAEGTTGAYVNEHGVIHQTLTVKRVMYPRNVILVGQPETRDSWFPSYAWTIALCSTCTNHLGWRFTLVNNNNNNNNNKRKRQQNQTSTTQELTSQQEQQQQGEETTITEFWGLSGSSICTSEILYHTTQHTSSSTSSDDDDDDDDDEEEESQDNNNDE